MRNPFWWIFHPLWYRRAREEEDKVKTEVEIRKDNLESRVAIIEEIMRKRRAGLDH